MRKYVLATVSLFALGAFVGLSQPASAETSPNGYTPGHGNHNDHRPVRAHFVGTFAYSANYGQVWWNWAITSGGSATALIDGSAGNAQGVIQINQNVGPNSLLQNSAAVSYVQARAGSFSTAVAYSLNWGDVAGNWSSRGECGDRCGGGTSNNATINNSFGSAQGVINVNQNAGDNSLLQNSTALAVFRYCGEDCAPVNLATVAVSANYGEVRHNFAGAARSQANATIRNSFGSAQGIIQVNQNAGANSLLQNSAAVAAILPSN